jgi:hypothetical protein
MAYASSLHINLDPHVDILSNCVRFEIFTVVTKKNAIFRDVTPSGSCKKQCFRGIYHQHHRFEKNQRATNNISSNYQLKHAAEKYCLRKEVIEWDIREVGGGGGGSCCVADP